MPLEFEKSIVELEQQLLSLKRSSQSDKLSQVISKLEKKIDKSLKQTYQKLSAWNIVQIARLPERPKLSDYIVNICSDFIELSGDRMFGDDLAIIGGFATIDGNKCILIGQEKGADTDSRLHHNFGMPMPEGYRKVIRLLDLANGFNLPVITLVDTAGAYPGIESEERNQAEAISRCIEKSLQIQTPIVSVIIGEGGSGGAIALATADYVLMMEYAIYSVISPEGCASILWKDETKAEVAANIQHITAKQLNMLGVVDKIIKEPCGGAHRNKKQAIEFVKEDVLLYLNKAINLHNRLEIRRKKFESIGNKFLI